MQDGGEEAEWMRWCDEWMSECSATDITRITGQQQ